MLLRHVAGVRSPEVGNSFWSRKLLGPELGNKFFPLKDKSAPELGNGLLDFLTSLNPFH